MKRFVKLEYIGKKRTFIPQIKRFIRKRAEMQSASVRVNKMEP